LGLAGSPAAEGSALAAAREPGWCSLGVLQAPDSLQVDDHIPLGELSRSGFNPGPFSTAFPSASGV